MQTKQKFITQEVASQIDLIKFHLEEAKILPHNSIAFFQNQKKTEDPIYIYDLGFKGELNLVPVSNHINKTGLNPLRGNQKENNFFYDITTMYQEQKNSQTAECFGYHEPGEDKQNYIQTRFLCNHVIVAYCLGLKTIFAYVID